MPTESIRQMLMPLAMVCSTPLASILPTPCTPRRAPPTAPARRRRLLTLATMSLNTLWYSSYWANTAFLLAIFAASTWTGSTFYFGEGRAGRGGCTWGIGWGTEAPARMPSWASCIWQKSTAGRWRHLASRWCTWFARRGDAWLLVRTLQPAPAHPLPPSHPDHFAHRYVASIGLQAKKARASSAGTPTQSTVSDAAHGKKRS